jgi:small subunit ribosomal protein S14
MSKKSIIEKNKNRALLVEKYAKKRQELLSVARSRSASMAEVYKANVELSMLPRYSAPSCINLRCALTGRSRGVYKRFRLSRIMLRQLGSAGLINGLLKRSW